MNVNVLFPHITLLNNMRAISITIRIVVRLTLGLSANVHCPTAEL